MVADRDYIERVKDYNWADVARLWDGVAQCSTPDWDAGKALEYVVLKGFELSGASVRWPYTAKLFGERAVEQIDGMIYIAGMAATVECKDYSVPSSRAKRSVGYDAIAKLQGQLSRRPSALIGCLFASGNYTETAVLLTHFTKPVTILCWNGTDIDRCIHQRDFVQGLQQKFRACLEEGEHYTKTQIKQDAL